MTLIRYKIGDLISLVDERNIDGIREFFGINKNKEFMPTNANTETLDERKYKVVRKGRFVYSGMQTGRDECIRISLYTREAPIIVSPAYVTFEISQPKIISSEYFFMFFLSNEKDRLGWFYSDSSIRSNLDWDRFCDIDIDLPPLHIQKKYVAIYQAMLDNQRAYENGLEDLKLVCDATIEKLRREMTSEKIGPYIEQIRELNTDSKITLEQGVNISKEFISPQRGNSDLSKRLIVRKGQFVYSSQLNNENVAIAYRESDDCVVSPVYTVFQNNHKEKLLDKYLMLWLLRSEWGRYVYWQSTGSSYEFLQWESVENTQIPIPPLTIQQSIVDIYNAYTTRKEINEQLKQQLKDICPILIAGAIKEAKEHGEV